MPKPISEEWYKAAEAWTDLESAATLLEETKSAVFSQWCYEQGDMSVSKAEMLVRASSRWEDHVRKIVAARTAANKAKIKTEFWKMRFWEGQSKDANNRLEAKL